MKSIWCFFTSLKLFLISGLVFIAFGAVGSILISAVPEVFGDMDHDIFFTWLKKLGFANFSATFWLYGFLAALAIINLNTLICSLDKLPFILGQINRPRVKDKHSYLRWTVFAPYLAHLGFLLVILGHLVSSASGFKSENNVYYTGEILPVPHMAAYLRLENFTPKFFASGMPRQFYSEVTLFDEHKKPLKKQIISINHPLFYRGAGFYQSSFGEELDQLELTVQDGTGRPRLIRLAEKERKMLGGGRVLTLKTLTSDFRGQGFGMAYFELTTPSGINSGAAYLIRGRNSVNLGKSKVTITDVVTKTYTVLTINQDKGAYLVLIGALLMTLFALVTAAVDYRKFLN